MSIATVDAPVRVSGRRPRLTDEDIQDLANAVSAGQWASDNEVVDTDSCAYQRAQSAVKLVGERFQIEAITTKRPVDPDHPEKGFLWAIGPKPDDYKPRKRKGEEEDTPSE